MIETSTISRSLSEAQSDQRSVTHKDKQEQDSDIIANTTWLYRRQDSTMTLYETKWYLLFIGISYHFVHKIYNITNYLAQILH